LAKTSEGTKAMNQLQRNALAAKVWSQASIESFYKGNPTVDASVKALCESHERLRAELQGAEARIALAVALTDTDSATFKAALREWAGSETGWRVVEKIREVLLGKAESTKETTCKRIGR